MEGTIALIIELHNNMSSVCVEKLVESCRRGTQDEPLCPRLAYPPDRSLKKDKGYLYIGFLRCVF